jgi:hypothetical protein
MMTPAEAACAHAARSRLTRPSTVFLLIPSQPASNWREIDDEIWKHLHELNLKSAQTAQPATN